MSPITQYLPAELLWLIPIAGVAGLAWSYIRGIWVYARGLCMGELVFDCAGDEPFRLALREWLLKHPRLPVFRLLIRRTGVFVRGHSDMQQALSHGPPLIGGIFWKRGPVTVVTSEGGSVVLRYLRGTLDTAKVQEEVLEELRRGIGRSDQSIAELYKRSRFCVIRRLGGRWKQQRGDIQPPNGQGSAGLAAPERRADLFGAELLWTSMMGDWSVQSMDYCGVDKRLIAQTLNTDSPKKTLVEGATHASLLEDARRFEASEQWYWEHGIPWRRGYLLHGPPGTGKTTAGLELARTLGWPLLIWDLSSMTNAEMVEFWHDMDPRTVVLFEDIHLVFDQDRNLSDKMGGGVTMDCLLNMIGGADLKSGVIVVVTTNDLTRLHPALGGGSDGMTAAGRPGRLDRVFHFGAPSDADLAELAGRFELAPADLQALLEDDHARQTLARAREFCASRALKLYWKQPN